MINSIFKNFPLNVMYWVENEKGTYELLDGQQRTLSICMYYKNTFFVSVDGSLKGFSNLTDDQRKRFLDYELQIYICKEGTSTERLDWFKIINIAGETLTNQELRNAIYTGAWITDAKRLFSKRYCLAKRKGEQYMSGSPIRQDYLETVLDWISDGQIESYMADNQHKENADREWQFYLEVLGWVQRSFTTYRREMKGVAWGRLYKKYGKDYHSATDLEQKVARLMIDDDVTNKKGIYDYVLSHDERKLNIRAFTAKMKRAAYERQEGFCVKCGKHFEIEEMQADHIKPWSKGGTTTAENCQMLCQPCNATKSNN
ncbi:MAG: HNH endonuclease [Prevotella sp.]|nr:HNH endonuclease [Prevotella sp.]